MLMRMLPAPDSKAYCTPADLPGLHGIFIAFAAASNNG
jgi:hypothetical protein